MPETRGWLVKPRFETMPHFREGSQTFLVRKEALDYLLEKSMEIDFDSARFVRLY